MEQGWVSLHRQIRDHWLWKDKPFARGQAWTDMILRANHLEAKIVIEGEVINIPEGAFFASETGLADDWGWSRKKVHGFIDVLTKEGMLGTKKHRKGAVFFLINYANFRYTGTAEEPHRNRTGTAEEPHRNTNNNDNNDNNENKERIVLFSPPHCGKVENSVPEYDITFHHHRLHDRYGIDVSREEVGKLMRELPDIDRVYAYFGVKER